ncbi:MAG: HlyD family efflux transporter periplasmic adaptor subunit, partial [Planctomycetales bacterium]
LAKIAAIELESARQQADNDIRIRYAREDALVSQAELEAMQAAKKGAFGKFEVRKAELQASRGKLGVEQATLEQKELIHASAASEERLQAAEDEIKRHLINAPIDGVIVDVHRQPGEWVTAGAPVFRLVRMDRLGIDGFLNIDRDGDLVREGMSIVATVSVGEKQVEAKGVVTYVEPIVQADGNYRVRVEVGNHRSDGRWLLRAGLPASFRVEIDKTKDQ